MKVVIRLIMLCFLMLTFSCVGMKSKPISDDDLMDMAQDSAADVKVTALPELAATPDGADITYIVDDPGGTPTSKKITITNLLGGTQSTLTNSAGLAGALSDETGTGFSVFSISPALTGSPTIGTSIDPDAADGATIGSGTKEWSDLYLANGGVIYFQNDQSVYLTSSANTLTLTGELVATGGLNSGTSTDPYVGLLVTDVDDTDWYIGVNADAGASSDDDLEFRTNATPGSNVHSWLEPDTGDVVWEGATDNDFQVIHNITDPTADRTITWDNNSVNFGHTTEDYVLKYNAATRTWSGEADSTGSGLGTNLTSATDNITSDNGTIRLNSSGGSNNEDLDFDFETTANTTAVSSSTGVTKITFTGIQLTSTSVETDFIPVAYFNDGGTAPASAATVQSTNQAWCRAFDGAANEDLDLLWTVPEDIDTSAGIKFSVVGYVGSATAPANTEVVAFSLAGMSLGNSDIISGAVGTAQTSSLTADATYVQYDKLETSFSSAITVTNLAAGETAHFDLIRLATTTDTYAQDFHVAGIKIKYQRLNNDTF
jgi:hypothetical protein